MNEVTIPDVPGTVLLAGIGGSTAYGLATPTSDKDVLGVFAAPTTALFGLGVRAVVSTSVVRSAPDPDASMHELTKLADLAAKSNPTVSELLWLPAYEVRHELGELLVEVRTAFPSTTAVKNTYGGYARQQVHRLRRRGGEDSDLSPAKLAKLGRHAVRLVQQGTALLATGELDLDCSARREELFAYGELALTDVDRFCEEFDHLLARFESTDSVLPDRPNTTLINQTLTTIRMELLSS